ncbi:hypothetical protein CL629_03860 [bacterium]|nr:hypothetical protein [bacterium]|tara:strand:+ start:19506 stop:19838 length:333 start_codon:yes stop_codon:yes gene_type:complete
MCVKIEKRIVVDATVKGGQDSENTSPVGVTCRVCYRGFDVRSPGGRKIWKLLPRPTYEREGARAKGEGRPAWPWEWDLELDCPRCKVELYGSAHVDPPEEVKEDAAKWML